MPSLRLTLLSPRPLPDEAVGSVGALLPGAVRTDVAGPGWHAVGLTGEAPADVAEGLGAVRAELGARGIDVAVTAGPLVTQAPGLVVTDVDSTLITQEVIELLAEHAGTRAEVAAVTERAMRGEIDFAESLAQRVATLAGLPVATLDDVRAAVRLMPGAETFVAAVHDAGGRFGVVSGGFAEIVEPLTEQLGLDHVLANRLEVADGRLTGRTTGPVVDAAAKETALRAWARADGVPLERTVAVGDGANDLLMLAAAGLGVAFCAKPVVRARCAASVSLPRLDAVAALTALPVA